MMEHIKNKAPKRKPTHMKSFDYSENYRYFITICADKKRDLFSSIAVGEGLAPPENRLSSIGAIISEQLALLPERYPMIEIENYVIMPNHIHMILRIEDTGGASPSPTSHAVVCTLKSLVTRECRRTGYMDKVWQRGYYDHVIRGENDYRKIWDYIDNNPAHWAEDEC
jgi:REP element-mobilizing transposase RayT